MKGIISSPKGTEGSTMAIKVSANGRLDRKHFKTPMATTVNSGTEVGITTKLHY